MQHKAAGILLTEKDENRHISIVNALIVRDGSHYEVPIIEFGWSKEEGRHVYLEEKTKVDSNTRKYYELSEVVYKIFEKNLILTNACLVKALKDSHDIKERMARNYVKFMNDSSIYEKSSQFPGSFRLV